jgi:hypothetical protein
MPMDYGHGGRQAASSKAPMIALNGGSYVAARVADNP